MPTLLGIHNMTVTKKKKTSHDMTIVSDGPVTNRQVGVTFDQPRLSHHRLVEVTSGDRGAYTADRHQTLP